MKCKVLAASLLVIFLLGIVVGCASTTKGKFQQSGKAVVEIGKAVTKACAKSKAKGWNKPLTLKTCVNASIAYDGAWGATKLAVAVIDAGGKADFDTLVRIGMFVLDMVKLLREAGIAIPDSAVAFVEKDISTVLEP
ncbi:MAG: hypothetical protein ACE5G5_14050 [Candidatus Methylomirabilales bacterium]